MSLFFNDDGINTSTKRPIMKKLAIGISILFMMFSLAAPIFGQNDRSSEMSSLMSDLDSTSSMRRVSAAKIITRSGFNNQELYKKIAAMLKADYDKGSDSSHIDEMSWLCKALAASGDDQYTTLLNEIAALSPSTKLQRYAKESASGIDEYAKRQAILNSQKTWDNKLNNEENRLVNMLQSGDLPIIRDAAKTISRSHSMHQVVYDATEKQINTMIPEIGTSSLHSDTLAWLCKALSASGNAKYSKTLESVISNTSNSSLQNHARKALMAL
jgi:hypothetical protein